MKPIEFKMKKSHKIEPVPISSEEIKFWEKELENAMIGIGWEKYIHILNLTEK